MLPADDRIRFIVKNTETNRPPHVPEIRLHLADEAHDLWHKTETELDAIGLPPPFWAFAWAGGQGLARHILDNPEIVVGKSVLDLATGSGLVAIAAQLVGAKNTLANDIDPFCGAAVSLNAGLNRVSVGFLDDDLLDLPFETWPQTDVIFAGDVFYDRELADRVWPLLQIAASSGKTVLVGDPGRSYLPAAGLAKLGEYQVPVTRVLEDAEVKHTVVWQVT